MSTPTMTCAQVSIYKDDKMEKLMPLKEECITYISWEKGTCHAMQGHKGSIWFWSKSKSRGEGKA